MKKRKILLAFSGGLDTSYCLKYLSSQKDNEVHSAFVHTGGFSKEERIAIEKKAYLFGAKSHKTIEKTEEYYHKIIKYLIFGNIVKNNTYPLSVSAERVCQALCLAFYAKSLEVEAIAHGSTGAGNDQIRFDMIFQILIPQIEIITPIRDHQLSREQEMAYLKKKGIEMEWEQAKYSVNKGLWGTTIGGVETLGSSQAIPEEAYPSQLMNKKPQKITLSFQKGEINGFNGKKMTPVKAIQTLDALASQYAIGRDIHIGDTIIGIKGRVAFEAAAATIIIKAHHTLEKHILSKWQMYWKEQLGNWYGTFIHESFYLEPVMRNIEIFLQDSQKQISGEVFIQLFPYRFTIEGIDAPSDKMQSRFGKYGEMYTTWTSEDMKGFIKIMANSMKIYNPENEDD